LLLAIADGVLYRAKFARGLLSGDYSKSTENAENTVSFHMTPLVFPRIIAIRILG